MRISKTETSALTERLSVQFCLARSCAFAKGSLNNNETIEMELI